MQITAVLRRAAQINPKGLATRYEGRDRTWADFQTRVEKLAGALQAAGMGPGDRVAMLSLNSDRFLEYFFAATWGGGAVMPLNIRWAPPECAYALNDGGAEILMVDDAFKAAIPAIRAEVPGLKTVIYCGEGETPEGMLNYDEIVEAAAPVPDAGRSGDDLAGIFYTGGTTGFPKGVMPTSSWAAFPTARRSTSQTAPPTCTPRQCSISPTSCSSWPSPLPVAPMP